MRIQTLAVATAALVVVVLGGCGTGRQPTANVRSATSTAAAAATASARASVEAPRASSCRNDGGYVWSHLKQCGWAGPSTTGPRRAACPGHRLAPVGSGPGSVVRLTRPGQVLSCARVDGCVSVEAPRVVLRDLVVRCTSGRVGQAANGTGVIKVEDATDSARINRVRLDGMRGVHACVWHNGARLLVNRMDCAHVDDGVFAWSEGATGGNNFVVANSYLHDFTDKTANGHIDGFQTTGASHGRIVHNTFLMTSDRGRNIANSAVAIWNGNRDSSDILVARNLVAGGGFAMYAEDYDPSETDPAGGNTVTDVRLVGNVFSRRLFPCVGLFGVWFPRGAPSDRWQRSGNRVLETGQRVDGGNPSASGRLCT